MMTAIKKKKVVMAHFLGPFLLLKLPPQTKNQNKTKTKPKQVNNAYR